jgi:HAD superfamily hydrolase (TIGR01450 family)
MTATLRASVEPLATTYDLALVDLDGVVYKGQHAVPHASPSLVGARTAGMSLVFVTNNASREPESVAEQLSDLGVPTRADDVFTAAQAGAALLASRLDAGDRVLAVGGPGLRTAVQKEGFCLVASADDRPAAVVQGFSADLAWADLAEAAYAVSGGAWFVATNLDMSLPTSRGLAPGNGALVRAVQAATGVAPVAAGKPEPSMYRMATERTTAVRPLVVGDRLDTDLAGARAAGIPGLHVLTGVSSARDAVVAPVPQRPDFIGADCRSLLEPHPRPEEAHGWWHCGDSSARITDGTLELLGPRDRSAEGLDTVRSACAAVWSAVDEGTAVDLDTVPRLAVGEP